MKIVQINATCDGSTGKICKAISESLSKQKIENYILYSYGQSDYPLGIKYSNDKYIKIQALKSRIYGNYGFNSVWATKRLINKLELINPDIVHFHNIHGHDLHLGMLFEYLKKYSNSKVFWTFHDCWAFTGYCPHFTMAKCNKWKEHCGKCPQKQYYSWFFDRSSIVFEQKKKLFQNTSIQVITPSNWLARLVKESFFEGSSVEVINNGIDLETFKPYESDFKKKNNLENKYVILGVAFGWGERKGLDIIIELSKQLDEEKYQIVLVGTDNKVDVKLPSNIISIHKTSNQKELAELYSMADVFINPTREDNYPTVNMEAIACGTPVITFEVGGSAEMLDSECGSACKESLNEMKKQILQMCEGEESYKEACMKRSKDFDEKRAIEKYIDLYMRAWQE